MRASLLVPTLNEGESIGHVLRSFREATESANRTLFARDPVEWELLVIDGASTDGTAERARAEGATVVNEPRKGYGRAYRTGFARATGEVVATLDGDATYPAERVPELLRYLLDHDLDFLSGDRLALLDRKAMTTEHRIGNRLLNLLVRVAYHRFLRPVAGQTIRDSQSGMWVFRRRLLEHLDLTQDGMPFSEELKLEVVIRGFRFEEVPIRYAERWGRPKLSTWRDGRRNFSFLLTKRLRLERELRARARLNAATPEPSPR
ncbi:MAG: glycosyltransferase family 2 protein [Thermoplasmata archaeon]|nr:glycosyltransferase family 2 protein [Thermoplasmata archaeon]